MCESNKKVRIEISVCNMDQKGQTDPILRPKSFSKGYFMIGSPYP